jgi:hypothetical protein
LRGKQGDGNEWKGNETWIKSAHLFSLVLIDPGATPAREKCKVRLEFV